MTYHDPQDFDRFELFDPTAGTVIREPAGTGEGYWVGAPGVMLDETDGDERSIRDDEY